jgi:hypothetical protein
MAQGGVRRLHRNKPSLASKLARVLGVCATIKPSMPTSGSDYLGRRLAEFD